MTDRGTGDQPGSHSPSRVSRRLRAGTHVAIGLLRGTVRRPFASSEATVFAHGIRVISGVRKEKHPPTHRRQSFAVRHRLSQHSPASPRGPFVVELFTAWVFQVAGSVDPVRPLARLEAPHAGRVERSRRLRTPTDGITQPKLPHPLCTTTARPKSSLSTSPSFEETHRIEPVDYSLWELLTDNASLSPIRITHWSLRRTARASLLARSSTGQSPDGW